MTTFAIIIWLFFAAVALFLLGYTIYERHHFRYEKNPYRRTCKKCGTIQEQYRWHWDGYHEHAWWEDVYTPPEADPNCACHKFSTYKSMI